MTPLLIKARQEKVAQKIFLFITSKDIFGEEMAAQYKKFDVLNVNLAGENLIEAAAGTGKTYSIAIMVLRWILCTNHPIDSVLAVTFTNYATAELKERILNFLEKGLEFFEKPENCKDETIKEVCSRITDKNEAIVQLKKAINDFDTASIFTIHGFCQKLIREHAFELGIDFKMELSEDADPANDTATAFFRQNIANCETTELLDNKKSREKISVKKLKDFISKAGIGIENKNIKLAVSDTPYADKIAEIYKDFVQKAPAMAKESRDRKNLMGFNDILLIIYEALKNNESTSESLQKIMEECYSFVLIDEFQDTDPFQYFIFKKLFCNGKHTVFFIGDPKQSIYSFRDADIFSYIDAKEAVENIYEMEKNYRSSAAAVEATNEVFDKTDSFGENSPIKYQTVSADKTPEDYSLTKNGKSLSGMLVHEICDAKITKEVLKKQICSHISQSILEMTAKNSPFKINEKRVERAVKPSDIAVLVAKNDFALEVCENLKKAGIPAIVEAETAKRLSIFYSEEASAMQKLISAASTGGFAEFKTLLLTFFYNKTVEDIADERNSSELSELHKNFKSCFEDWKQKGFFASFSKFLEDESIIANIAAKGGRTASIIRQLSELIHKHELSEGCSPVWTPEWFKGKIKSKSDAEDEIIRTEGEKTESVRIMTLHKSKGLEFNIVFFPFILNQERGDKWVLQHRKKASGGYEREMILEKASETKQYGELPNDDELEEKRRIYVGVTRAKYLTVCYTQETKKFLEATSLFFDNKKSKSVSSDELLNQNCTAAAPDEEKQYSSGLKLRHPEEAEGPMRPEWALTSFSGIISQGQTGEGSLANEEDDPENSNDQSAENGTPNESSVPMALFPSGTDAGTVLHSIFEKADFSSEDNTEIIRTILKKKMNFNKEELEKNVPTVNGCLNNVFSAPIFDGGRTLRDGQNSKTAEMEFFLSIKDDVLEGKLSKIIEDSYKTAKLEADSVKKGFLHGYIDLVAKVDDKYYIIDWKSNNLKEADDPEDPYSAYNAKGIEKEMKKHNYYLQYMLYLASFDRYMQSVDKNYSYEKNFGGIRYVFLRGVNAGSDETGIFSDRPAESELRKIQELFEGKK